MPLNARPKRFVIMFEVEHAPMKKKRGLRGFSLIELLIVISIILIILAIALPRFNKAQMQAHEVAAIATMRTLHSAETQYYSTFGRYAVSLQELGKPTSGNANASAADLIGADLAKGEKQGYRYTLQATPTGYTINADPVAFNNSGSRTFFSDQSQETHQHFGPEPATNSDPELK
jgi:type IV pilus assembly protein PilA